jgi:uncharacterized protein (DUF433 family)
VGFFFGFTNLAEARRLVYASVMKQPVVTSSAEVMGGTPVFAGTRVPVQTLFDSLEAGDTIDEFLEGFPTVDREQVIAFLEESKVRMLAQTRRES